MTSSIIQIKNMINKKFWPIVLIFIFILLMMITSLVIYLSRKDSVRRTFIFPSVENGSYIIEHRNLAKNTYQGDVQFFIEEMLLGSTVERTKLLFRPGTKLLSCFERNGILYLNLSSDLLEMGDGVVEIREGITLLEQNIKKNFPKINKTEIFIDGKSAFEK